MPDRDQSSNDLGSRMEKRFESDKQDKSAKSDKDAKHDKDDKIDYRDEWSTRLFYLPEELADRIADQKKRMDYECDWEIGMERHYYPVIAEFGISQVEEMSGEEFTEVVEDVLGR